jgi:HEAT repeat protein
MKQTFRQLKQKIQVLLRQDNFKQAIDEILQIPGEQAINPLFSFFYSKEELIRWRAITAMGAVVEQMADLNLESARIVMRRLMWNLNDESGGIGWGSPEAMGEIMARHDQLAKEYHRILISYMDEKLNYLEYEPLQRGVLWAVGRLAHARPELLSGYAHLLVPYLSSPDAGLRGLAAWAAIPMDTKTITPHLNQLLSDDTTITLFLTDTLTTPTISQLSSRALSHKS